MRASHPAVIAVVGSFIALAASEVHAQEKWSYEMVPFLWAAGIDGREGVGNAVVDVDASFKDLVDFVNIGAALRMSARRPPVGWFAEASYVELEADADTAIGAVRTRSTQTFAEGGLSYDFNSALAVYAGLRYQQLDTVLEFPSLRREGEESWVDGIVGARWTPIVSDNWVAWVRGDVGGGSSDLVWLAEAGGGYRWGSRWAAYLAYRVLDTDYEHNGFVYDMQQSGLLFGFGVRF